ncbi:MAG: hypothetical protein KAJ51_08430, partial [Thermoplasmata archaeon]|nr:hypothetical protein [Thermoplasmata archaeon]
LGARSEPASLQFSCVNNLPEVARIQIRPPDPSSDNAISCDADGSDPDGDEVKLKYKWFKNGVHQPKYDDKLNVISAAIVKGDNWKVEVTPFDGFILGAPKSISVEIDNSRPTCKIQEPLPTFEIRDNKKTTVRGTYEDADGDELVSVSWYVDIDDPTNYTAMASEKPIRQGDGVNVLSALEFKYEFSKGTHNLTLVVFDADSLISMTPSYDTIQIEVTRGGKDGTQGTDLSFIIGSVAGVIIIIILLSLLMLFLKRRKPVSEREKMYGKDMGLKQGEAYPVEEEEAKSDSYFGDKLDRKGVSSLDSSSTVTTEKLATTEAQTPQMPEKT